NRYKRVELKQAALNLQQQVIAPLAILDLCGLLIDQLVELRVAELGAVVGAAGLVAYLQILRDSSPEHVRPDEQLIVSLANSLQEIRDVNSLDLGVDPHHLKLCLHQF